MYSILKTTLVTTVGAPARLCIIEHIQFDESCPYYLSLVWLFQTATHQVVYFKVGNR